MENLLILFQFSFADRNFNFTMIYVVVHISSIKAPICVTHQRVYIIAQTQNDSNKFYSEKI